MSLCWELMSRKRYSWCKLPKLNCVVNYYDNNEKEDTKLAKFSILNLEQLGELVEKNVVSHFDKRFLQTLKT
ncbi:13855_t:CDS:2 [Ambispora leptoticha]|uniref:13855_t:CDS:1 n=1 Tax=Ambispora leptoticha TaxID=144679 RepID=A0A9N8V636_9GLOM|nr:13855_t:CDS:2 [Ambispora leptoticha]